MLFTTNLNFYLNNIIRFRVESRMFDASYNILLSARTTAEDVTRSIMTPMVMR